MKKAFLGVCFRYLKVTTDIQVFPRSQDQPRLGSKFFFLILYFLLEIHSSLIPHSILPSLALLTLFPKSTPPPSHIRKEKASKHNSQAQDKIQ